MCFIISNNYIFKIDKQQDNLLSKLTNFVNIIYKPSKYK